MMLIFILHNIYEIKSRRFSQINIIKMKPDNFHYHFHSICDSMYIISINSTIQLCDGTELNEWKIYFVASEIS